MGGVSTTLTDYDFVSGESDDAFGLAWQATAGCRYELIQGMDLGLAYKYLGTTDRTFNRLEVRLDGTQTHSVRVSFSMTL